ncbi:MAG: glycosyltransferase family 4 protein [bacterium]|nr:glycosyltransferase family 4 protein [bacterium]
MNVLFATTSYPADSDDPRGIHIHRLARSLAAEGVKVRVVAPGTRQNAVATLDGVTIDRRAYWWRSGQRLAEGLGGIMSNIRNKPWLVPQVPFMFAALYRGLKANAPWADVVHAHWLYPAGLMATYATAQTPLVVTSHGGDLNRIRSRGVVARSVKRVFEHSHTVLGVSEALTSRAVELGCDPSRALFQPLGVDLEPKQLRRIDWTSPDGALRVAFVGSLIERKAPDVLIEALADLSMLGTTPSCAFVGAGPLKSSIENAASKHGIDSRFLGNVAPDEVACWLAAADLLCLPSWSEGRPLAVMEAMAAGIPVVASDIDGVSELVTVETGILVDPGDSTGFAKALHQLAIEPARRSSLGAAGRARIGQLGLTTRTVARSHIEIYEAAIEESRT